MVTKLGPLCIVKLLNNPEKAGVGGSTPSLATIIPKHLAESCLALPVRSQSAIFRRDPVRLLATMMVKDLSANCLSLSPLSVRFCLAAWLKIGVSIAPAAAMRSSLTRRDMEAPFRTGCVHFQASPINLVNGVTALFGKVAA